MRDRAIAFIIGAIFAIPITLIFLKLWGKT